MVSDMGEEREKKEDLEVGAALCSNTQRVR